MDRYILGYLKKPFNLSAVGFPTNSASYWSLRKSFKRELHSFRPLILGHSDFDWGIAVHRCNQPRPRLLRVVLRALSSKLPSSNLELPAAKTYWSILAREVQYTDGSIRRSRRSLAMLMRPCEVVCSVLIPPLGIDSSRPR